MTFSQVLIIHIVAGAIGLFAGAVALAMRKGSRRHRAAGNLFFIAMAVMSTSGVALAFINPQMIFVVIGSLALYLVTTGWVTAMRRDKQTGAFEAGALIFALAASAGAIWLGMDASNSATLASEMPPNVFFILAGEAAFFAALDASVLVRGGVAGAQRIARHLWRMCYGMFFGAFALFIANPQVFPEPFRSSNIRYAPIAAIFLIMVFWLLRVLFTKWHGADRTDSLRLSSFDESKKVAECIQDAAP